MYTHDFVVGQIRQMMDSRGMNMPPPAVRRRIINVNPPPPPPAVPGKPPAVPKVPILIPPKYPDACMS